MKNITKYVREGILSSTKSGMNSVICSWLEENWFVNKRNIKNTNDGVILDAEVRFNVIDFSIQDDRWKKFPGSSKITPGPKCKFYFREDEHQLTDFDLSTILSDKKPCSIGFYDFKELTIPEWLYKINLKKLTIENCEIINNLKLEEINNNCTIEIDKLACNNILQGLFKTIKFKINV